jgi:orotate phosphoribosyltransferase
MLKKSILSIALKLDHAGKAFTFDMRELFNDANTAVLIDLANQLWAKIKHLGPEVLLGKGIGSYPLLLAVKMRAFELDKVCLSILFVRDQRKQTGLIKKEVEGPLPLSVFNKKTVFIDDIYNSGGTFEKTKDTVFSNDFNLDIVGIAVVVDFYKHSRILRAKGYPFFSLTNLIELGLSRRDKDLPKVFNAERWFNLNYQGEIEKRLIKSTPVIYKGNVYIGNDNTNHYCFDSQTGDLKWVHTSALPSFKGTAGITACHDDLVYWSSYDGTLTCAHYDTGKVVWKSKLDANLHSSPCLDVEGNRIFIGTEWDKQEDYGRGDVVCLEMSSGKEVWRTPTDGMIPSTALYIASKNTVVCGSNDFHVYFLQADTGRLN